MVLQIKKSLVVVAFLVFLAMPAFADQSELVISVNAENKLYVEKLFDDDGSIELVEICVLTLATSYVGERIPTESDCSQFENVIEGQVFNITLHEVLDPGTVDLAGSVFVEDLEKILFGSVFGDGDDRIEGPEPDKCYWPPSCTGDPFCEVPCDQWVCGDGECLYDEDYLNCPTDCSNPCGNGICSSNETCFTCQADCSCVNDQAAAYYNFIDTDGQVTNAKFLVFASAPTFVPALENTERSERQNIIATKTLTPKVSPDNKSFEVEARVKINSEFDPIGVTYLWLINEELDPLAKAMAKEEGGEDWVFTLGPFEEPITLRSSIGVNLDEGSPMHTESFGPRFLHFLSPNEEGICEKATFSQSIKPTINTPIISLQTQVTDQPFWDESISRLRILPDPDFEPGYFYVKRIRDETIGSLEDETAAGDDIDFLNIFIVTEEGTTQHTFVEVKEGDVIDLRSELEGAMFLSSTSLENNSVSLEETTEGGVSIVIEDPIGAEIFYNFMDSDDDIGNMNLLLPLNPEDLIDAPFLLPIDRQSFIEKVEMEVIPSLDCSTFKIRFRTTTPPERDVQRVYLRYGYNNYSLREQSGSHTPTSGLGDLGSNKSLGENELVLELQGGEDFFEGELGPFSSVFELFSRVYAESTEGATSSWQNFFSWFGIEPLAQQGIEDELLLNEICGNRIDDDGDGSVDEGCVILPDLLFVGTEKIPSFVSVGESFSVSATVKNAGVIGTPEFQASFFLNDDLIAVEQFDGLSAEEEKEVIFTITDSTPFLGVNIAKISIDPTGNVPELNIANNEIVKKIIVGYNSFNIILNFNDTDLLGDFREFRAFDGFGKPASTVTTLITYPSGGTQEVVTNKDGINEFQLSEGGIYSLTATKNSFEPFEAIFIVPKINLLNLKPRYELGDIVSFSVKTEDERTVGDALVEIKDPNNQITVVKLDEGANGSFQTKVGGPHEISVTRNGVQVFQGAFLAGGLIESFFVAGGVEELLFGSIVKEPPLFILMILLAFGAGLVAFSRSKLLFKPGIKSTRQERLENVERLAIAVVFFFLPFQVSNYFGGFNAGLAMVIIEVFLAFFYEHYKKRLKENRTAIRVK